MAAALQIDETVVTEDVLRRRHAGQTEVRVATQAVVTPSGWDYLRLHRLRLNRGPAAAPRVHPQAPPAPAAAATPKMIPEVLPPGSEAGLLSRGRCDHPERPFGCRTEEFGSGFVEPSSCRDCAARKGSPSTGGGCACGGCNKAGGDAADREALVQRLTDEIMARLGGA